MLVNRIGNSVCPNAPCAAPSDTANCGVRQEEMLASAVVSGTGPTCGESVVGNEEGADGGELAMADVVDGVEVVVEVVLPPHAAANTPTASPGSNR